MDVDLESPPKTKPAAQSLRLDLDDVNGEVVLLRWGEPVAIEQRESMHEDQVVMRFGPEGLTGEYTREKAPLYARSYIDGFAQRKPLSKRMLALSGNELVEALPKLGLPDPVGADIKDIPVVLKRIKDDWADISNSSNRMTAYTLQRQLRKRMLARDQGTHDGSVDLLITGCEVSLWLGEQFASDLHLAFPRLSIEVVSANKLLGQLGQGFPTPQAGFLALLRL